ncbi:hypothetical protein BV25DRAFT_1077061 [Artomyces pyxidatus]|uniref:Uncharacterized protein n=1 Tax=Artomyces pyxidatus TaxID=48021 RepID=A0ACB8TFN5_9AGAM|nr:hypothetical protein BV25DRAFT_1077061 [Artomyces pyxidatus]
MIRTHIHNYSSERPIACAPFSPLKTSNVALTEEWSLGWSNSGWRGRDFRECQKAVRKITCRLGTSASQSAGRRARRRRCWHCSLLAAGSSVLFYDSGNNVARDGVGRRSSRSSSVRGSDSESRGRHGLASTQIRGKVQETAKENEAERQEVCPTLSRG